MNYLVKDLADNIDRRQDLTFYLKELSFVQFLHSTSIPTFLKSARKRKKIIADHSAGFVAKLGERNLLKRSTIVFKGLCFCRDSLELYGFDEVVEHRLREKVQMNHPNCVLVAGCQDEEILANRIKASASLWEKLYSHETYFVLSGRGPSGKVRIRRESNRMEIMFYEELKKRNLSRPSPHRVITEGESTRTIENVKEFLKQSFLKSYNNSWNLYLISSTFHMPRLCREFEKQINNKNSLFKSITLVCTENIYKLDKLSLTEKYLKKLFFEVYLMLMDQMCEEAKRRDLG